MELRTAKGRLFLLLSLIFLLPLLNYNFNFTDSGKLSGAIVGHPDITFSPAKWWDGSYQKEKTLFLNDSVGFRQDLVRLSNQIDFTFFKKVHVDDVYVGRDNYFFSEIYVDEYEGAIPMNIDVIRKEVIKLKMIQDTLARLGKTFIFTYALSKPYCYPDKIPSILVPPGGKKTSYYDVFKRLEDSLKITQLDFNALLVGMKDTTHAILSAKFGCHWSTYGSIVAADTLIKLIEHERNIKMHELTLTGMHYSNDKINKDADYGACTNLIFPLNEKFCNPEFVVDTVPGKTKPKIIFIGDSFVWTWVYTGIFNNISTGWEYWYYFNEAWDQKSISGQGPLKNVNDGYWEKSIQDADCIVTVFTPMNFRLFENQTFFLERLYNHFYPGKLQ